MSASGSKNLYSKIRAASNELKSGRRPSALSLYSEVARQAGDDPALNMQLGHLCCELADFHAAIGHYAKCNEQVPDNPEILQCLAVAWQRSGQLDKAAEYLERALVLEPDAAPALSALGSIWISRGDPVRAKQYLERAYALKPGEVDILRNLAIALEHANEYEPALGLAEKALKRVPSDPDARFLVAEILSRLGRTDEAIRHLELIVKRKCAVLGASYDLLARVKRFTDDDRPLIGRAEKLLSGSMSSEQRYSLHFALGKMYDDCGDREAAFRHYRQANLLQKKDFDLKAQRKWFGKIKRVFTAESLRDYRQYGNTSEKPLFIVGMPRSGTTLVEQIVIGCPRVASAGELSAMARIARSISPDDKLRNTVAATRANLTPENIRLRAAEYLSALEQGRDDATRIVDKLPLNFLNLGLISVLFPDACIIHTVRHPLDTCLSCYFQNFTAIRWANELESIAGVYRFYREVMDYWSSVLPEEKVIEVQYERLVDQPESESRRILERCGLTWDSSVLNLHKRTNAITTASLWQARQPIYQHSKNRWTGYASHLGPLSAALSDYLVEDRDELREHGLDVSRHRGLRWFGNSRPRR